MGWMRWGALIAALAVGATIHYGFALWGEPQSLWLWRDVLGVM